LHEKLHLTGGCSRRITSGCPISPTASASVASDEIQDRFPSRSSQRPDIRRGRPATAFAKGDGGDCLTWRQDVREYRDIRRHVCLPCVDGNDAEVRRCTTINCPFWPYRMGVNPHNPKRGRNPFSKEA